jgi:hypothetical protein
MVQSDAFFETELIDHDPVMETVRKTSSAVSTIDFTKPAYIKPASRPYFYKDKNGDLKKYHYCSLCTVVGPFTDEEVSQGKLKQLAGEKSAIYYCPNCLKSHGFDKSQPDAIRLVKRVEPLPPAKVGRPLKIFDSKAIIDDYFETPDDDKPKNVVKFKNSKTTETKAVVKEVEHEDEDCKTLVFFARGKDNTIFCSQGDNPRMILEDINNLKSSQSGLRKQSIPFVLLNEIETTKSQALSMIVKFRKMTKERKERYIKDLGGNQ